MRVWSDKETCVYNRNWARQHNSRKNRRERDWRPLKDRMVKYQDKDSAYVEIEVKSIRGTFNVQMDTVDLYLLNTYTLSINRSNPKLNGASSIGYAQLTLKEKTYYLQRMILNLKPGDPRRVEFKDGNQLNCRRNNLKVIRPKAKKVA